MEKHIIQQNCFEKARYSTTYSFFQIENFQKNDMVIQTTTTYNQKKFSQFHIQIESNVEQKSFYINHFIQFNDKNEKHIKINMNSKKGGTRKIFLFQDDFMFAWRIRFVITNLSFTTTKNHTYLSRKSDEKIYKVFRTNDTFPSGVSFCLK